MKKWIFLLFLIIFVATINLTEVKGISSSTNLLMEYEPNYEQFTEVEIADKRVYYQQRKIGEAIVEKDFTVYQFDKDTGQLITKKTRWRDDLPKRLPKKITKEQAESMAEGEVQFTKLYFISPESDVFPIEPTPENPVWVVRSNDGNIVTIIDAVTGENLGNGVPLPYTAFSLSGPQVQHPCWLSYWNWYQNAETWFNTMGYSTEAVEWPSEAHVRSHIQSSETAMFYEVAHTDTSYYFISGCTGFPIAWDFESTYASEIETWIADYLKMPFTFLASCMAMCNTGDGTLSYEFRKGSMKDTVTVGYCGMSNEECALCWENSVNWQDAMFNYMNQGWTVKAAFDQANADYPMCASGNCIRFEGDENFAVVPVVGRRCYSDGTSTDGKCHTECGADPDCDEFSPGQQGECPAYSFCTNDCQCSAPIVSSTTTTAVSSTTTTISGGACTGTPNSCSSHGNEGSCTGAGCDWTSYCTRDAGWYCCDFESNCNDPWLINVRCTNLGAWGCSGRCCKPITNPSTCDGVDGCHWVDRCSGTPSPCSSHTNPTSCTGAGCDWLVSSTTTTRRRSGGGGGGCLPWECALMAWGLNYTNILVILIAAVVVVIVLGGFKFFAKK